MSKIKDTYFDLQAIIFDNCTNFHYKEEAMKKEHLNHRVLSTTMGTLEITYESSYDEEKDDDDAFSEKLSMTECKDGWKLYLDRESYHQYPWYDYTFRTTLKAYLSGGSIEIGSLVKRYDPTEYTNSSESKPSNNDTLDDISKRLAIVEDWIYKQEANKFFDTLYNDLLSNKWVKYIKDMAKGTRMGQELFNGLLQDIVDLVEAGRSVPSSIISATGDYAEYAGLSINDDKFMCITKNSN